MHLENVTMMLEQLHRLGFGELATSLTKHICLSLKEFSMYHTMEGEKEATSFRLFYERTEKEGHYRLVYFDATLSRSDLEGSAPSINGLDVQALEGRLAAINWRNVFDLESKEPVNISDPQTWKAFVAVEEVVNELHTLESSKEGGEVVARMKVKYWEGLPYQRLFGTLSKAKASGEITQRFYCSEGTAPITADEACRFVKSRQIERQVQEQKRLKEANHKSKPVVVKGDGGGEKRKSKLGKGK